MARQYINFCEGTLNAGITDAATTVYVNFATNSAIPDDTSWGAGDYMVMAIDPEAVQHQPELVKVTAITGSGPYTLTIGVGQKRRPVPTWAVALLLPGTVAARSCSRRRP